MVNSDKELKYLLNKFGFGTDLDSLPDEVFSNLTNPSDPKYSGLRNFAKDLKGERRRLYQNGRLGMIIDGTGDDFKKISMEKKELEAVGYDCYMVFVNTSLDVAIERNRTRSRSIPEYIVQKSWKGVQSNMGAFQKVFGHSKMLIVDNNRDDKELVTQTLNTASRFIRSRLRTKPENGIAMSWIKRELEAKKRIWA